MRLERFYIGQYRVLQNLELDFKRVPSLLQKEQSYSLDFLVGVNGTGKSTVLRLLGRLFARLRQGSGLAYQFDIPLSLRYVLGSEPEEVTVEISNLAREVGTDSEDESTLPNLHYRRQRGEKWDDWEDGSKRPLTSNLPRMVIYSSGNLDEWLHILTERTAAEEVDTGDGEKETANEFEWPKHRPSIGQSSALSLVDGLTFIEPRHLPLVALSGLLADHWEQAEPKLSYVFNETKLKGLQGFSLRLRFYKDLHDEEVNRVRNELAKIASRVVKQGADWLLVFENLPAVVGGDEYLGQVFKRPLQLFEKLFEFSEPTDKVEAPLQEVNLFLERTYREKNGDTNQRPMLHLFNWFSDGEKNLVARMALFSLFREDGYLILLDEPEVHFNDVWKREIINILDQVMEGRHSHTLITTHSSIALTDVPRQAVMVLERQEQFTTEAHLAGIETLGADPSDILVHVFNTPTASGERGVSFIQREIAQSRNVEQLDNLLKITAPGYWRYRIQLEKQRMMRVS